MVKNEAIEEFVQAIQQPQAQSGTTYSAIVARIDDEGVVWVNLAGSDKETPTASVSAEVEKGDVVTVEWRNNKLYIAGNYSNPSAGMVRVQRVETTANVAHEEATQAVADAEIAHAAAELAQTSADSAKSSAESASESAKLADDSAKVASDSADSALLQLSDIEKVVDVLTWVSEHGTYELTEDPEVQDGKYYFELNGTSYDVVEDPTGNPQEQGLYELSGVDEAVTNYVSTHLALVGDTLYVQTDDSDYKLLISSGGISLRRGSSVIAQYSDTVILGDPEGMHMVLSAGDSTVTPIVLPELGFYQGGTRVAYINTQKLFIESAEITGELSIGNTNGLRIGNFVWKPRDGRLTLMYSPI